MPSRAALVTLVMACGMALGMTSASARPLAPPWEARPPFSSETAVVTIDGRTVDAEIADTGPLRERGLSYRDRLEPDTGMLFVYGDASVRSFWMFEMRFCLDIIWINDGRIVGAAQAACPASEPDDDIPRFGSPVPVQYVLEVGAGWMADNDVRIGASVEIELPPSVPSET